MASPATNLPSRVVLTIETDPAGLDAKALVERYQKFFDFYHPAYNVKVKSVSTVETPPATPVQVSESVLD